VENYSKNKKPYTSPYSCPNSPPKSYSTPKPETQLKGHLPRDKGKGVVTKFPKQLHSKRYFKCQIYGYFQDECPNRKALIIKEIEEIDQIVI